MQNKQAKIALIIGAVVAAVVLIALIFSNGSDSSDESAKAVSSSTTQTYLLCKNPECGKSTSVSAEEYGQMLRQEIQALRRPPRSPADVALKCTHCGQKKAYAAKKCADCGELFFADTQVKCAKCRPQPVETYNLKAGESKEQYQERMRELRREN